MPKPPSNVLPEFPEKYSVAKFFQIRVYTRRVAASIRGCAPCKAVLQRGKFFEMTD